MCIFGFYKPDNKICVPKCKANEEFNGTSCICQAGFGLFKNVCTKCPSDAAGSTSRTLCTCPVPNYIFNKNSFKCEICQANSRNSDDDTTCICNAGYKQDGKVCTPICEFSQ